MRKYIICMISFSLILGFSNLAQAVDDATGENIGDIDLISATAEVFDDGDNDRLKITLSSTPSVPGLIVFEVDVDNSTGTGGGISMTGIPVPPCPCKTSAGFDIVIIIPTRVQGKNATSAVCSGCLEDVNNCARKRWPGEWYASAIAGGTGSGSVGSLRGFLDPSPSGPSSGATEDCYTLPWSSILAYVNSDNPEPYDWDLASNPANIGLLGSN